MAAVSIAFNKAPLTLKAGESLLQAAERVQITIPSSCRSGVCQSCLVQVSDGDIPAVAQSGLSEQQKRQGLALACQLKPLAFLSARSLNIATRHSAHIVEHQLFNNGVLCLRLHAELTWYPGQFVTVWRDEINGRPYSVASLCSDDFLEFHIKKHEHGRVSGWLHEQVRIGDTISVSEARGNCFYDISQREKPLLLVGSGTGLAPLYGIVREALIQGHRQPVVLYVCAKNAAQHYLLAELDALALQYSNLSVIKLVRDVGGSDCLHVDAVTFVQKQHASLRGWCVFLCGAPALVKQLQKVCFLSGASMADIHADAFVTA